jgi:proteasome assembly chaperone (PAC2) family protein
MKAFQVEDAPIKKPIVIAAMQDMGNVGSIAIDFVNKSLQTSLFRYVSIPFPNYVVDNGGYVDFHQERWEYRHGSDGAVVVFGGGMGQPQTNQELYDLCHDVIDTAAKYSAQLIYTLGAFHTARDYGKNPKTLVTATTHDLSEKVQALGFEPTPGSSLITGFNGLILGLAKEAGLQGIGLYAEIDDQEVPQYRAAKSLLLTLEKLTYQKFRGIDELDELAGRVEGQLKGGSWKQD